MLESGLTFFRERRSFTVTFRNRAGYVKDKKASSVHICYMGMTSFEFLICV